MARIRTIKPEFPQSESMGRVSRDARLLFIMLWTIADDAGRARAASRMLASLLFPYDDDAAQKIPEWLMELERENCVRVYAIDGNTYLQIEKWDTHQKIANPTPSRLPPAKSKTSSHGRSRNTKKDRETLASKPEDFSRYLVPRTMDLGMEGTKEEVCAKPSAPALVASPPLIEIPTNRTGENFGVSQTLIDEYAKDYPGVDVFAEFLAMRAWSVSNPTKRKTSNGMLRFANAWLSKAQNRTPRNGHHQRRESPYEQTERIANELIREDARDEEADFGPGGFPRVALRPPGDERH